MVWTFFSVATFFLCWEGEGGNNNPGKNTLNLCIQAFLHLTNTRKKMTRTFFPFFPCAKGGERKRATTPWKNVLVSFYLGVF